MARGGTTNADWIAIGKPIVEAAKVLAVVVGGFWVYWKFFRQRTHASHMEFDVSCEFWGPQDGAFVAEYTVKFSNKDLVLQKIRKVALEVRGIERGTNLEYRRDRDGTLSFPSVIDDIENIVSD